MFDNIGKKIKSLASILCWVGIIASVITAIIMFIMVEEGPYSTEGLFMGLGFAFLIIGPLSAWASSFFMYGFGELIDKTCDIERNTRGGERKSVTQNNIENDRIDKLERLLSQGLITEEEYQLAIEKENK